jgi:hypothetical protein
MQVMTTDQMRPKLHEAGSEGSALVERRRAGCGFAAMVPEISLEGTAPVHFPIESL